MYRRTGEFFGINEGLFSSALAAMVFSILGAQPLTIVGVTGLISLFNYTIYDIVNIYEPSIYPNFMCWTAIWAAIFHWVVALCNLSDYMRYVTDFSSESFGMYVGIIYISQYLLPETCAGYGYSDPGHSQGCGRTRQRVRDDGKQRRFPELHDRHPILRKHLWTPETGDKHGFQACV